MTRRMRKLTQSWFPQHQFVRLNPEGTGQYSSDSTSNSTPVSVLVLVHQSVLVLVHQSVLVIVHQSVY